MDNQENLIIYNTDDGKVKVALYARDGNIFMSQAQLAELFDTSVQNISNQCSFLCFGYDFSDWFPCEKCTRYSISQMGKYASQAIFN